MAQTVAFNAMRMDLWEGDTTELTKPTTKGVLPPVRAVTGDYQVVYGRYATAYYMALQIIKSTDRDVIMRALASATAVILQKSVNFTGSPAKPDNLSGLEILKDEAISGSTVVHTNFKDEEEVTKEELLAFLEVDEDELGAFFGLLYIAGNKKLTPQNRSAFNERRVGAATMGVIGEARIFVPDSRFLDDTVIQKMNACFNSRLPLRAQMVQRVVTCLPDATMGPAASFSSMFTLLVDFGMGGLRSIREVMGMYAWTRSAFPELLPQVNAANEAFKLIKSSDAVYRPFLKAIHGNNFVPVSFNQISNLVGVCKHILSYHSTTFGNYGGGTITEHQRDIIDNKMNELGIARLSGEDNDRAVE